jgi:hypothetical protein
MRYILFMVLLCSLTVAYAKDFLTIYNQNQALYKTDIELDLRRGIHFYSFENIPTGIITESVIFVPTNKNVQLFSQNFEYDLANSHATIQKYIDKSVRLTTEMETYVGTLIFFDGMNYGLLNPTTNELNIVSAQKVDNVQLSQMPDNFYTRPTLRWQLRAPSDGKYKASLSYMTSGIDWRASYNVVLGKNDFTINSWVTINNRSGKAYENVNLKLMAGNIQTFNNLARGDRGFQVMEARVTSFDAMAMSAPEFAEREFSDFRLYTLSAPVDIENNQEKQLSLYPLQTVRYTRKYEYTVGARGVDVFIAFNNSKASGLGLPLPAGNMMFYEMDTKDNTQQFVGVARIEHTSLNQDVSLKIGTAFDIVAEHKILSSTSSNRTQEIQHEVSLTNNKSEAVEIEVIRRTRSGNAEILSPSTPFTKRDATTYVFRVNIAAGRSTKVTFTERISN